jgi:hypothetical protein
MKHRNGVMCGLALVLGICAEPSRASTIETFTIGNGGLETFNLTWDGHNESALAGGITLTRVSGSIPTFTTLCTDIGATVYLGYNYNYSTPTVFNNQDGLLPSWGAGNAGIPINTPWTSLTSVQQANSTAAVNAAADIYYHHQSVLSTGTTTERAALQLAVWEALYDTTSGSSTLGLNAGRFSVSSGDSAAISLAAQWIQQVNASAKYAGYLLIPDGAQNGTYNQEMFYNVTPVPEATTVIAGALLLLPFGLSTLRFLRGSKMVA